VSKQVCPYFYTVICFAKNVTVIRIYINAKRLRLLVSVSAQTKFSILVTVSVSVHEGCRSLRSKVQKSGFHRPICQHIKSAVPLLYLVIFVSSWSEVRSCRERSSRGTSACEALSLYEPFHSNELALSCPMHATTQTTQLNSAWPSLPGSTQLGHPSLGQLNLAIPPWVNSAWPSLPGSTQPGHPSLGQLSLAIDPWFSVS